MVLRMMAFLESPYQNNRNSSINQIQAQSSAFDPLSRWSRKCTGIEQVFAPCPSVATILRKILLFLKGVS
jgi:hypothetical protein